MALEAARPVASYRDLGPLELILGLPDAALEAFVDRVLGDTADADALRQAESYGYMPGERETVQLADGYRVRGDTLMRNARQLSGMPQERDYVQRAVEAYQQSLMRYLSITDLSRVGPNIRLTQRSLDIAELKLGEFSPRP